MDKAREMYRDRIAKLAFKDLTMVQIAIKSGIDAKEVGRVMPGLQRNGRVHESGMKGRIKLYTTGSAPKAVRDVDKGSPYRYAGTIEQRYRGSRWFVESR